MYCFLVNYHWTKNLRKLGEMTEKTTEIDCILRSINCEINLLSRSDGSTMFMQGIMNIVNNTLLIQYSNYSNYYPMHR